MAAGFMSGNPMLGKAAMQAGAGLASDAKTGGSIGRAPGGNMVGGRKSFLQKLMEKNDIAKMQEKFAQEKAEMLAGTSNMSTGDISNVPKTVKELEKRVGGFGKDDRKAAAALTAGAKRFVGS